MVINIRMLFKMLNRKLQLLKVFDNFVSELRRRERLFYFNHINKLTDLRIHGYLNKQDNFRQRLDVHMLPIPIITYFKEEKLSQ